VLAWLLVSLKDYVGIFNVFGYFTVRTALAGISAFVICMLLGQWVINLLKKHQIREEIRELGPKSHLEKKGTPSMGGILIICSTLLPTILWADLSDTFIQVAMFTMLSFGLLGFWDDYLQIKKKKPKGLVVRYKFISQIALAGFIGLALVYIGRTGLLTEGDFTLHLSVPFFKQILPYLGIFYLPWIMLILVSSSNAVNMADGLDGLAIGLTLISVGAFTFLSYVAGNVEWSGYLQIPYVISAAELTIFLGAMFGACLGFLWFNCHPAQVFMGDTGALSLGGTLGVVAILIKQEFLLFLVAGVFILETLSVLFQVGYFKMTGGKRIFKMAPLHHHFELIGWSEEKIVVRFWIAALVFALFSLTTLKLR
jgi:phospho-N-acetylmuramoyl-pentapeptide-transferase